MNSPSPTRGYYSILQYVPDLERNEGANVGVVLFCPERKFLKAQTATGNDRVRRFFSPDEDLDLDRINAYKAAFEERVALESEGSWTLDEFKAFVNTRANLLLLTEPRPIKVSDPQAELAKLFESLVGGRKRRTGRPEAATRERELSDRFDELLAERGLLQRVERNVQIDSPLLDRTLVFPFAYRNGNLNVIQSVAFEGSKNNKIDRACQLAVEGQDLAERLEPIQLTVLGSFRSEEAEEIVAGTANHVRNLSEKFRVPLHTVEDMKGLVEAIERTAH